MLYGQGIVPEGHHPLADAMSEDDLELTLSRIRAAITAAGRRRCHRTASIIRSCCAAQPGYAAA